MIGWPNPCNTQTLGMLSSSTASSSSSYLQTSSSLDTHSNSLLYNLSLLKEKFHQLECEVSLLISPTNSIQPPTGSTATAIANMGDLVQDITVASTSMLLTCQQMTRSNTNSSRNLHDMCHLQDQERGHGGFWASENFEWFNHNNHFTNSREDISGTNELIGKVNTDQGMVEPNSDCDIVELDAANLLAKYTHYCQICGKGFKRDANLRMHMRAHGDEYKSRAALINPMRRNASKRNGNISGADELCVVAEPILPRKYSCPQEGCRWNKKHEKFQPLKSMICVKNHYKRSHCPKMYICKRCNNKEFSVLSDLKTHEKHCGDVKWRCSCGTTFSRKDKLVGHVALFVGHVPVTNIATTPTTNNIGNLERTEPRR